jgi:hypothetical protein
MEVLVTLAVGMSGLGKDMDRMMPFLHRTRQFQVEHAATV